MPDNAGITSERVYLYHRALENEVKELRTRVDVLEWFIKQQYPEFFAGEVGTVADLELKPIPISYTAPEEADPDQWKDREHAPGRTDTANGESASGNASAGDTAGDTAG